MPLCVFVYVSVSFNAELWMWVTLIYSYGYKSSDIMSYDFFLYNYIKEIVMKRLKQPYSTFYFCGPQTYICEAPLAASPR